jgi:hypothetical protein
VLNRVNRRVVAKELLHRQNHSNDHTWVLTYLEGSPCETSIQGPPHVNDADKGGHHTMLSEPKLHGLNKYQDIFLSTLAYLWDDGYAQPPDVDTPSTHRLAKGGRITRLQVSPVSKPNALNPEALSCKPSNYETYTSHIAPAMWSA